MIKIILLESIFIKFIENFIKSRGFIFYYEKKQKTHNLKLC